jgi:hypothetical protein
VIPINILNSGDIIRNNFKVSDFKILYSLEISSVFSKNSAKNILPKHLNSVTTLEKYHYLRVTNKGEIK